MLYIAFSFPRYVAVFVLGLVCVFGVVAFAQESLESPEVISDTEELEVKIVPSPDEVFDDEAEEELVEPQLDLETVYPDATVFDTDAVAEAQVFIGEVVAVDADGSVVIETADGELVRMSAETLAETQVRRAGGTGRLLNPRAGEAIVVLPEDASVTPAAVEVREATGAAPRTVVFFITSGEGREQLTVSPTVPVYRNGVRATQDDIRAEDAVFAVRSADGTLLAIDAEGAEEHEVEGMIEEIEEEEEEERDAVPLWVWGLIAVALVLVGFFFVRR